MNSVAVCARSRRTPAALRRRLQRHPRRDHRVARAAPRRSSTCAARSTPVAQRRRRAVHHVTLERRCPGRRVDVSPGPPLAHAARSACRSTARATTTEQQPEDGEDHEEDPALRRHRHAPRRGAGARRVRRAGASVRRHRDRRHLEGRAAVPLREPPRPGERRHRAPPPPRAHRPAARGPGLRACVATVAPRSSAAGGHAPGSRQATDAARRRRRTGVARTVRRRVAALG